MIDKVTIGSDPEFIFEDGKGNMLESYNIIRPIRFSTCGQITPNCSECRKDTLFCGHGRTSAEIGTDGALGELRPKPGNNPLEHVENIQKLFHAMTFLPSGTVIKGGTIHHNASIGGHIHIGMPIDDKEHCAKFLSHFAGIPLRKIERPIDVKRRGYNNGFGRFGGYDIKGYGLEWRMPASWLVSKEIGTAALCLAYVVARNYDPEYVPMKTAQYHDYLKSDIAPILSDVEKMEGYDEYRREITPLFTMIEQGRVWNINENALDTWI